jgi:lipopolysaccharide transport system permease protein
MQLIRSSPEFRRRVVHTRDLLRAMLVRETKLRYERSALGIVWALLNPLAQILIFTFVFKVIFKLDIPNYPAFLFTGVLVWNWFREAITASAESITNNRDLLRQPGFPLAVLPAVAVAVPLIDLLAGLPVLVVFILADGGGLTPTFLLLPVLIALQFLLVLGMGFLLASLHVTFRDIGHLLGVALMMLFYLTPVFYSMDMVPDSLHSVYVLNPIVHFMVSYRRILLEGLMPDWWALAAIAVFAGLLLRIGWTFFVRAQFTFEEEL